MSLLNTIGFITNHPLNREHKICSISRFIKWQVGSRLVPGGVVFDWINGSKFYCRTGENGLTGNVYAGLHEFSDMGFLIHALRAEDLFVDIGANAGSYTILGCAVVGAKGVAFEPVPSTYDRLVENMRLNHLEVKVECVNKGVGAEQGRILFTSGSDTVNHALADGEFSDSAVTVVVTTLDSALGAQAPFLMKIDVEGYETPVLAGAQKILGKETLCAVIMELNGSGGRYGFDESKILGMMAGFGFKTYSYNPLDRSLVNLQGKNLDSGNTLFIRNMSVVEERLKGAPIFSVHGKQF